MILSYILCIEIERFSMLTRYNSLSIVLQKGFMWLIITAFFCMLSFKYIDLPVLLWVQETMGRFLHISWFISNIGLKEWWIIIALIGITWGYIVIKIGKNEEDRIKGKNIRKNFLFMTSAMIFGALITQIFKTVIGRPRPELYLQEQMYYPEFFTMTNNLLSFPSGHASLVWGGALSLSYIYPRICKIAIIVATLVSLSRVAVSAHYLSDIVTGMYLGWFCTILIHYFFFGKNNELKNKSL